MHIKVYFHLNSNTVVIPTSAKTKAGFYVDQGPIEIADIGNERAVFEAASRIWSYGHPLVPTPHRNSYSHVPSFKLSGVRKWSDVERQCSMWDIMETSDHRFKLEQWVSPPRERGFVPDPSTSEILPEGSTLSDSIRRLIARLRALPPE